MHTSSVLIKIPHNIEWYVKRILHLQKNNPTSLSIFALSTCTTGIGGRLERNDYLKKQWCLVIKKYYTNTRPWSNSPSLFLELVIFATDKLKCAAYEQLNHLNNIRNVQNSMHNCHFKTHLFSDFLQQNSKRQVFVGFSAHYVIFTVVPSWQRVRILYVWDHYVWELDSFRGLLVLELNFTILLVPFSKTAAANPGSGG